MSVTVRTVIAEDNPLLRDGIALLLGDHDIAVGGRRRQRRRTCSRRVAEHRPDIAVVDVRMPPTHTDEGLRAAIAIRASHPDTAVLVFSQWVETTYARRLLLDNPAKVGYLLKDRIVSTDEFLDALRRVAAGGTALDPEVIRQLLAAPSHRRRAGPAQRRANARSSRCSPRAAPTSRSRPNSTSPAAAWRST